jgi:hypothetical protein
MTPSADFVGSCFVRSCEERCVGQVSVTGIPVVMSAASSPDVVPTLDLTAYVNPELARRGDDASSFGENLVEFGADQEHQAGQPQPRECEQGGPCGADDRIAGGGDADVVAEAERQREPTQRREHCARKVEPPRGAVVRADMKQGRSPDDEDRQRDGEAHRPGYADISEGHPQGGRTGNGSERANRHGESGGPKSNEAAAIVDVVGDVERADQAGKSARERENCNRDRDAEDTGSFLLK